MLQLLSCESRNTAQLKELRSNKVLLYLVLSCVKRVLATARLGRRKRSSWGSPIFAAHKRRRRLLWGRVIFNCLFSKRYIISIEMRRETSAGMDSGAWGEFRRGSRFWFTPTRHYYKRFLLKIGVRGCCCVFRGSDLRHIMLHSLARFFILLSPPVYQSRGIGVKWSKRAPARACEI